jgi:hypothetical protein
MRQKAERKIRQAAAGLGEANLYRIDQVRSNTDLIRKVFDKTLLHMASLGTIDLKGGDTDGMNDSEISNLIYHKDILYVYFSFLEENRIPAPAEPQKMDVLLEGIEIERWRRFEALCESREGKKPLQKINEIISEYNQKTYPGETDSYLK